MNSVKLVSDTIDKDDIERLVGWLRSDPIPRLTKGQVTIDLEQKWSNYLGTKHTTYVNSGSSAILLSLAALQQSGLKNNKVVVPALSWLTDVSSVMLLGMSPILCDCNLTDLSVDIDHLERIFKSEKPAAFILVSVLGLVPNMEKIVELCEKHGVFLIEDVCESMGSKFNGKNLGTFGRISLFSMYYGHHLSSIEGGFICTDDSDLHNIIHAMRSHGWARDWSKDTQQEYRKKYNINSFDELYTFYYPGMNVRSTDLQAYIAISQIDKLDDFSKKRNKSFYQYQSNLPNNLLKLSSREGDFISSFAYPYVSKNRMKIVKKLQDQEIEVRPLIAGSMARQPFWTKAYGQIALENADIVSTMGFYLPNHQDLTSNCVDRICKIINQEENS